MDEMEIDPPDAIEDVYPLLTQKSPYEIYKLFFDKEVEQLFVEMTIKYARDHNDHGFDVSSSDIWKFFYNFNDFFLQCDASTGDVLVQGWRCWMRRNCCTDAKKSFSCNKDMSTCL